MEAKGWGERDLAFAVGTAPGPINQILNDRRSISLGMAKALSAALDRPAEDFARAQAEWDIQHADAADPRVAARARILSRYPLREMVKRGWIDPEHQPGTLEQQVCRFFGVTSLDDVPHLEHSAKKTDYSDIPPSQLAWLYRVRQIAEEMHPPAYSETKLREAIEAFKEMRSEPDAVRHVPRLLNEAGVRYVVSEGLPGALIDGVCFWLGPKAPVIGMSMRFDRIDNFWFVLRHECAHVLHGHGKAQVILDEDIETKAPASEEERIANSEAAEFCVPSEQMRSFYLRKNPFFSEIDVLAFSKRMKVHPGIAVGQLQRMSKRYDILRKHLVRVRAHLARSMMMDGWGDVVPVGR
ncbi:MAG: ImmA/IrrE family metallo-endopeptidase [Methylobacteriaceae bacterium]|nr:ImmA/IrrE family metallo-endopeptidase [Methylobacteriaceae bacterium]